MYSAKLKRKKFTIRQRLRYHFISCASICSIHGFAHIVRKNVSPYERLLWFLLVTSATAWCIELGLQAWDRYQTRPTVISLERDHWKWNTTFPAVTLCLSEIDNSRAEILTTGLNITNETEKADFKNFLRALATVNFELMEFEKYINNSLYQGVEKYLDWVLEVSATFDPPVDLEQTFGELREFDTTLTELGFCFVYNSQIAVYSTPEYLLKRVNKPVNISSAVIMINPSIPTPTLSIRNLNSGYQIFFHGPNEIAEMSTKGMVVPPATFGNFELSISSVYTASDVKKLKISQRNCRLSEESNLKHSPVYSYHLCRVECRRHLCLQFCNCVPYYYIGDEGEKVCDTYGMECLYNHKDSIKHLTDKHNQTKCSCIQNCDVDSVSTSKYEVTDWFLGTNLQWKVVQYPTIRYKRSLIFSDINVLVQIGGVAGLFLGCSVLSLIELIFYFTIRFYWGILKGRMV